MQAVIGQIITGCGYVAKGSGSTFYATHTWGDEIESCIKTDRAPEKARQIVECCSNKEFYHSCLVFDKELVLFEKMKMKM